MKKKLVYLMLTILMTICAVGLTACGESTPNDDGTHTHSYTITVTKPTCTEEGYTTYTCACGDSYKADETNATGHTEELRNVKVATEDEQGYSGDKYCKTCNNLLQTGQVIEKLDHIHSMQKVDKKDKTCTANGNIEYYTCTKCNKNYNDNLGTIELSNEDIIILASHGETEIRNVKPATEEEKGYTGDTHCKVCGDKLSSGEEIEKLNHAHKTTKVNRVEATCTTNGNIEHWFCACGKNFAEQEAINEITNITILASHGETEIRNAKEATEDEKGYTGNTHCKVCGEKLANGQEIPKLNHTHNMVKTVRKEATCTVNGNIEYYTCTKCNKNYNDNLGTIELSDSDIVIEASHNLTHIVRKEATCTLNGNIEYWHCLACEKNFTNANATSETDNVVINASHGETEIRNAKPATEEEKGYTGDTYCKVCGEKLSSGQDIPKLNHTHNMVKTDYKGETCTANGNIEYYTCTKCNKNYNDNLGTIELSNQDTVILAKHILSQHNAKAPTCEDFGWDAYEECSRCDYSTYNELEELGHNYGTPTYEWSENNSKCTGTRVCSRNSTHKEIETVNSVSEITQNKDCELDELTKYTVAFTNTAFAKQVKENIKTADKLGHEFANYVSDNNATYDSDGTKTATCNRNGCNETDTITDVGSKLDSSFRFKTLTVNPDDTVYGKLPNGTSTFSFLKEIEVKGDISVTVSANISCSPSIPSKTVALTTGDNVYYVLVDKGNNDITLYTVTLRVKPMYTVSFDTLGGSSIGSQSIEEDALVTLPTEPIKDGYTFVGWKVNGNLVTFPYQVTENTTFTAEYTPTNYTVTLHLNGGSLAQTTLNYNIETGATLPTNPTRDYYTFAGWFVNENLTGSRVCSVAIGDYGNKDFYASWTPVSYSITYTYNGGVTVANKTSYNVETPTFELLETTRDGYRFGGWYNKANDQKVTSIAVGSHGDLELYAKWELKTNVVHFNGNGATSGSTADVYIKYTETGTLTLNGYEKAGYTFKGWATHANDSVVYADGAEYTMGANEEYTLYAVWLVNANTIIFNGNGATSGDMENMIIARDGDKTLNLNMFTRKYYHFVGWSTTPNGSVEYTDGSEYTMGTNEEYALYAVWGTDVIYSLDGNEYKVTGIVDKTKTEIMVFSEYMGKPVTNIDSYAFSGCNKLIKATIPNSITEIGYAAFEDCYALQSITLPFVGESRWDGAYKTTFGYIFGYETRYDNTTSPTSNVNGEGERSTTFENSQHSYASGTWQYTCYTTYDSYYKPSGAVYRKTSYFYHIPSSLKNVTITDARTIPVAAFNGCKNITTINLNDVTEISNYAFQNCSSLKNIIIPDSVTSIGKYAFNGCKSLESITLPFIGGSETATNEESVFGYIFGHTFTVNSYETPSNTTFQYEEYDGNYTDRYYYYIPSSLKTVTITNDWRIGKNAFYNCSNLSSIVISDSVRSIQNSAFRGCSSLESITIPSSVTSIGEEAFYYCSSLESITIPSSVTSIGSYAFESCSSLTKVYYGGTSEQWSAISVGSYNTSLTNATRYYYSVTEPALNVEGTAYDGNYWRYVDGVPIIWFPSHITVSATDINLDDTSTDCTASGDWIAQVDGSLKSPSIGHSSSTSYTLTMTNGGMFIYSYKTSSESGYDKLTVYKNGSATSVSGVSGVQTSFTEIALEVVVGDVIKFTYSKDSSQARGDDAVYIKIGAVLPTLGGEFGLQNNELPDELTTITVEGEGEISKGYFQDCLYLTTIYIGNGVVSISDNAFNGCTSLTSIYYIGSVDEWNEISIGENNEPLLNATIYYFSEEEPDFTDGNQYWRYVDSVPTAWVKETAE